MKNSTRTIVSLLGTIVLSLTAQAQTQTQTQTQTQAQAQAQAAPTNADDQVSAIIYSDIGKDEMLAKLSAFVRIGEKLEDVPAKTGLEFLFCLTTGPGVTDCHLPCGLQLVADPDGAIQVIRRDSRDVDGKTYTEMSISTNILQWHDYARGYPE